MVLFNYSAKELTAKVVYYGPGLGGKTTNLQWIHEKLPIKNKGKMLSLATETDRTLFFDFIPIELGSIRGMKTRIQLYTVPGQVFYNATRRMVLKGADCVVFVCDSQEAMLDANLESMENLRQNLEANEIDPDEIPMVLQYNKRDLPNALPLEILNEKLNLGTLPFYEAVAVKGLGVEETLKGVTGLVFRSLASRYGKGEALPAAADVTPTAAPRAEASPEPEPATSRVAGPTHPPLNLDAPSPDAEALLDSLELRPAQEPLEEGGAMEDDESAMGLAASREGEGSGERQGVEEEFSMEPPPGARFDAPRRPHAIVQEFRTGLVFPTRTESRPEEFDIPTHPGFRLDPLDAIGSEEELEEIEDEALEEFGEPQEGPIDPPSSQASASFDVPSSFVDEDYPGGAREPQASEAETPPAEAAEPPASSFAELNPASTLAGWEDVPFSAVENTPPRGVEEPTDFPSEGEPERRPLVPETVVAAVPVAVHATTLSGPAEVTIPVEVTIQRGTTQVHINLRLTLNLKVQK